jgi:8-oxo-dGTP pyrophosphatase MutT (NUDIX family)
MFIPSDSKFKQLINTLSNELKKPLPGIESQLKMAPSTREQLLRSMKHPNEPKQSAVLILLFPYDGEAHTVFIQRNVYDGVHSGQIAFPGGRHEPTDSDLVFTALREANEELSVVPNDVTVIGKLTKIYIPPSNFDVLPVVGCLNYKPEFRIQPSEISGYFMVKLDHLENPETTQHKQIRLSNGMEFMTPCYVVGSNIIWGATSMILNELIEVLKAIRQPSS